MNIALYKTCTPLLCTILFGLLEFSKIALIKDFILEKNEFKVTEKNKIKPFPATLASIKVPTRSLKKVILDNSNRPNRILLMNLLHDIYSVIAK